MTILEGDIKLLASRVMDDVPEGGGGPTGTVIPYGGSNHIFRDITEADRAGGNASVMQVHAAVMTDNAEPYMGANFILSMPPTDDNVAVTLAKCNLFARRTEIAQAIANYLIKGPEWSGYLLEDHVAGQRAVQILHRPGTPAPNIGRTLVLLYNEGKAGELIQYVRVTRTTTEDRTFTYNTGGSYVDFQASVTQVDLSDVLRYNFPGSPPDRTFGRNATKTLIRDTTVADAATYYGASPTVLLNAIGDTTVKVASIYSQIVPNSRTASPIMAWSSTSNTMAAFSSVLMSSICKSFMCSHLNFYLPASSGKSGSFCKHLQQSGRNAVQWANFNSSINRCRRFGHAIHRRALLILGDGQITLFTQQFEALGAVTPHAGQEYTDGVAVPVTRHAFEEDVDRRPINLVHRLRGIG